MSNKLMQADSGLPVSTQQQQFVSQESPRDLNVAALAYHRAQHADDIGGKIEISVTKPVASQDHLSLAYSPGVAVPCLEIARDPELAYEYTAKGSERVSEATTGGTPGCAAKPVNP